MSSWQSWQIFPSLYLCSQYQMDDGKSIRYKDLYALFEHILEKSMRQEQRDWCESPVKVWVNTFKVFLDEFMTEYKPMEGTIGRVRKLITAYRHWKKSKKYNKTTKEDVIPHFPRTFGVSCTSVQLLGRPEYVLYLKGDLKLRFEAFWWSNNLINSLYVHSDEQHKTHTW